MVALYGIREWERKRWRAGGLTQSSGWTCSISTSRCCREIVLSDIAKSSTRSSVCGRQHRGRLAVPFVDLARPNTKRLPGRSQSRLPARKSERSAAGRQVAETYLERCRRRFLEPTWCPYIVEGLWVVEWSMSRGRMWNFQKAESALSQHASSHDEGWALRQPFKASRSSNLTSSHSQK